MSCAAKEALSAVGAQPWEVQEACYGVLLKLLGNVVREPAEAKFRSVKSGNATIKAKVFDCPGGSDVLLAAGFVAGTECYTLPDDASVDTVQATLDELQHQASTKRDQNFRALRDEKIAREKAAEAKLNEIGGFARGRHKLGASSEAVTATPANAADSAPPDESG
eukprot:TRINITY_DN82603_c0_g1_i1.p1 TRINITY_DN82603_c0_g1~~TRINITY_DN82603_c0_g1_i1.p1  ORF type:complete len:165 (-),score=31.10 TRINITY_DN82603_c0_g1_i1:16-510(-)